MTTKDTKQRVRFPSFPIECDHCSKVFKIKPAEFEGCLKHFCSSSCMGKSRRTSIEVPCVVCSRLVLRLPRDLKRTKNSFCSHQCAATYQNAHKTTGYSRSKLEMWLETQLPMRYPQHKFTFNNRSEVGLELDIYIPELKLAFELNGIFHYEPIYGEGQLVKIQTNDKNKFQRCQEAGISLCIIDVSGQKYFKESTSKKYLDIIVGIINEKAGGPDSIRTST